MACCEQVRLVSLKSVLSVSDVRCKVSIARLGVSQIPVAVSVLVRESIVVAVEAAVFI